MRRSDHSAPFETAPFDHELEADSNPKADLTDEFWGRSPGWRDRTGTTPRIPRHGDRRDDTTGALRVIRDGVAAFRPRRVEAMRDPSGEIRRTRSHGDPSARTSETALIAPVDVSIGDLAAGTYEPSAAPLNGVRDGDIPLSPTGSARGSTRGSTRGRTAIGGIDPLLARLGALALVGALLVPIAMALRPTRPDDTVLIESPTDLEAASPAGASDEPVTAETTGTTAVTGDAAPDTVTAASGASDDTEPAASSATPTETQAPVVVAATAPDATEASAALAESAAVEAVTETVRSGIDGAATVDIAAQRVVPDCPQTYVAAAGDSWYRIADEAGVSPTALLAENRSTLDTVIFPGDEICLPSGATVPSQPTTTTTAPTTAPPTTNAPTTTDAPSSPASVEEVKQMIRDTWPADQHETALYIAKRESNFDPLADNNFCCFGIFQIYWNVHKGWLDDYGIYSSNDLLDARKNIAAAYALYERSGGWGPWGF